MRDREMLVENADEVFLLRFTAIYRDEPATQGLFFWLLIVIRFDEVNERVHSRLVRLVYSVGRQRVRLRIAIVDGAAALGVPGSTVCPIFKSTIYRIHGAAHIAEYVVRYRRLALFDICYSCCLLHQLADTLKAIDIRRGVPFVRTRPASM